MRFTHDPEPAVRPFTEVYANCDNDTYRVRVTEIAHDTLPGRNGNCAHVQIGRHDSINGPTGANPLTLSELREAHEMLGLAVKEVERRNKERDEEVPF